MEKTKKKINRNSNYYQYKNLDYRLKKMEKNLESILKKFEENRNADLMIISRLENIADFLKNNYNVVIEEKEKYTYPY